MYQSKNIKIYVGILQDSKNKTWPIYPNDHTQLLRDSLIPSLPQNPEGKKKRGEGSDGRTNEGLPHYDTTWKLKVRKTGIQIPRRLSFPGTDFEHYSWFPTPSNSEEEFWNIYFNCLYRHYPNRRTVCNEYHGRVTKATNCLASISCLPPYFIEYFNKITGDSHRFRAAMS